jgi:putative transposase
MPVSRFCQLTGIPRRTYHRWQAKARAGDPPKGPWPAPVVTAAEPLVAKYAADWPGWGTARSGVCCAPTAMLCPHPLWNV